MKIYTRITNGKMQPEAVQAIVAELSRHNEKDICVTIERKRKTISISQRNFLNGVFVDALQAGLNDAGMNVNKDLAKTILKEQYGIKDFIQLPNGEKMLVPISTEDYTPEQCEKVMEDARRGWAKWIQLPYPNENLTPPIGAY